MQGNITDTMRNTPLENTRIIASPTCKKSMKNNESTNNNIKKQLNSNINYEQGHNVFSVF